ncbi:oligosaccharide flippase family protein [Shewanella violacea]|uniref:Polysaccharide biosynthesis family protein n=1 Tax=Shewanella violacea (strain JCM 10179 / CIP 106290 / LMG 19151 / DSS12) TaxID=637905 RepID=D4ZIE6_SHEVD|nr:oligosaccharide flippase family protein [Shewanella violacea]BAJ01445.1 polysaccharide biosynthesis family protein [Shewanella violacea DSS12]
MKNVVLKNFTYLSLFNIMMVGFPIFIYPLVVSRIGSELLGKVVFYQTFAFYITVVVNFGFNITSTKKIANNEVGKPNILFWDIFHFKIATYLICVNILFLIFDYYQYDLKLVFFVLLIPLYDVFVPQWYYHGRQTMGIITTLTAVNRVVMLFLIYFLVQKEQDYILYAAIISVIPLVFSIISFIVLINGKEGLNYVKPNLTRIRREVSESQVIFYASLSSVIKDRSNVILIGSYIGYTEVAAYDLVLKLINIISGFFSNYTQAFFPHMSQRMNVSEFKSSLFRLSLIALIVTVFGYIVVFYSGEIFGFLRLSQFDFAFITSMKDIAFIVLPIIFIRSTCYMIGLGVLITSGLTKEYAKNLWYSNLVYMLLISTLVIFEMVNIDNLSYVLVGTLIFELLYRIYICIKHDKSHWIF